MGYDVSKEKVDDFLKRTLYKIPRIQRRYSWLVENWERLWTDLENYHKDEHQSFYLLHTVITVQGNRDDRIEILDGQQRTTTMLAMISAAIDIIEEHGQSDALRFHVSRLTEALRDKDNNVRLVTYYPKDAPMLEWIQTPIVARNKPKKLSRVWKAYNFYFTQCFEPILEERGVENGCRHIAEVLYESMLLECYVTMAKFGSMPEAVTAFDTTNNTGKSLSTADLLRYWMLRNARHPEVGIEDHIDEKWNKINDVLEDKDKDIKDFVVRYWCGRLGERYQASKLLKHLDAEMDSTYRANKTALQNLMTEMADGAALYHDLINPATNAHNRRALRLMRKAGASQHLTTLLAGKLSGYDDHQMARLINLTEKVFFWYQIVAERGGSALYQKYANWAGTIFAASSPEEGLEQVGIEVSYFLVEHGLDEATLKHLFEQLTSDKVAKVTFVLGHLEIFENPETKLRDEDDMAVHRVVPISDETGAWTSWSNEDREKHTNKIGNWVLLPAGVEQLPEGYTMNDVVELVKDCEVESTKAVSENAEWYVENVNRRQSEMFGSCLKIWPL